MKVYTEIVVCKGCPNRVEMHTIYKPYGMSVLPLGKESSDFMGRYLCREADYREIKLHESLDAPDWCPLPDWNKNNDKTE